MKALILAGGEGTRLRPLTLSIPKPVVPVVNIPFLRYQLGLLQQHGIVDVILSLGYQPSKIQAVLGDGSAIGTYLRYVVETSPLGTAGAYKNAEQFLQGPTVVFNGDILCDLDLSDVLRQHRERNATATLVLTRVENPSAYGLVETDSGRIERFLEKPKKEEITCNTINAGTYILEPEVLEYVPAGQNYSFERGVFPSLLKQGKRVFAYISSGYWIDIGTPQKYMQVHQDILQHRFKPCIGQAEQIEISLVDIVDSFSRIGQDVQIKMGTRIESSCIGDGCRIGSHALIKESILWPGVTVGDHVRLEGSIIGRGSQIGRNATISAGVVLGDGCVIGDYSILKSEEHPF
jgi:mannose-1-phosphate guanylyltransferase